MNIHKNARLTLIRRVEMVEDVLLNRLPSCQAATRYAVSEATVRKWLGRFLAEGREGLMDRSSRPAHSPLALTACIASCATGTDTRNMAVCPCFG